MFFKVCFSLNLETYEYMYIQSYFNYFEDQNTDINKASTFLVVTFIVLD
jgi:hypothetical protein